MDLLARLGRPPAPQRHLLGIKQRAAHPARLQHHHLPRLHRGDALLALAKQRPGARAAPSHLTFACTPHHCASHNSAQPAAARPRTTRMRMAYLTFLQACQGADSPCLRAVSQITRGTLKLRAALRTRVNTLPMHAMSGYGLEGQVLGAFLLAREGSHRRCRSAMTAASGVRMLDSSSGTLQ